MRFAIATATSLMLAMALAVHATQGPVDPLPATCNPFGLLAAQRPLDQTCGLQGAVDGTAGQKAQDRVKNNLCAYQNATPVTITRFTFDQLQSHTPSQQALPWGSRENIPDSDAARNPLHLIHTTNTDQATIGEGSYVEFVGFILEGHFGGSESVNCNATTRQNLDIHVALVTVKPSTMDLANYDSECASITAEISGHRRPIDWEVLGRMTSTATGKKLTGAQTKLADENLQRPIRVRGQLMFDASHSLCANGHRTANNPARRSGWEIHPVYAIDVCSSTSLATCKASDATKWTPLDQWLQSDEG